TNQRNAELIHELLILAVGDLFEAGLGDVSQRGMSRADIVYANDITNTDADMLGILETVQDRVDVLGPFAQISKRFAENRQRGQTLNQEAIHQLIDHARVAGKNVSQIRASGTQPYVKFERGRIKAEQLPQRRLAAKRIANAAEINKRRIRLGRAGNRCEQPR